MKVKVECPDCGKEHEIDLEVTIRQRLVRQEDKSYKEVVDLVEIKQI